MNSLTYRTVLLLLLPVLSGCGQLKRAKRLDEHITLRRTDKIPYGTFVAFENIKYLFPSASVTFNNESPAEYTSLVSDHIYDSDETNHAKALYVIITPAFHPDQKEYKAIMRFVGGGNHVFISSFSWSLDFTDSMNLKIYEPNTMVYFDDSLKLSIRHPVTADSSSFSYPGKTDDTYFIQYDSNYSSVLGRDETKHPNLLRQTYQGGGSITIQSDPMAFSNFFLLHKKNNEYYN